MNFFVNRIRTPIRDNVFLLASVLFVFAWEGCASTINLPSHWNDQKIVVDGKNNDWDVTYLIDNNKLMIGFENDSNYVYLLLATNDRNLAMSMARGLTVWFDPAGKSEKMFGIRYPVRSRAGAAHPMNEEEGGDESSQERTPMFANASTELEILGPGKEDVHRMQLLETGGIQARVNLAGNAYVYEMRVPYRDAFPFSIKAKEGAYIGLGLETSNARLQRRGEFLNERGREGVGEGNENPEMGRGGVRGGERGGFGKFGQETPSIPESLDIWMKVRLITGGGERRAAQ